MELNRRRCSRIKLPANKQIRLARKIRLGLFDKPVVFVSERRKGANESAKFDWLFVSNVRTMCGFPNHEGENRSTPLRCHSGAWAAYVLRTRLERTSIEFLGTSGGRPGTPLAHELLAPEAIRTSDLCLRSFHAHSKRAKQGPLPLADVSSIEDLREPPRSSAG